MSSCQEDMAFWKFFLEEDQRLSKYPRGQQQLVYAFKYAISSFDVYATVWQSIS